VVVVVTVRLPVAATQPIVKVTRAALRAATVTGCGLGPATVQLPGTPLSATVCSPAAIPVAVTLSLTPMGVAGPPSKLWCRWSRW